MSRAWVLRLWLLVVAAAPACGGSPSAAPAPPIVGDLIDRIGRPATGTALVAPLADPSAHADAVSLFKTNADGAGVVTNTPVIAASLPLYDALDGTCGNQLLAQPMSNAPARYATLSALRADDRLWVDTASASCRRYLAVELGVAGDCGGRAPDLDIIDAEYSYLALGQASGVTDGVDADPDGVPSRTAFPFLIAPK